MREESHLDDMRRAIRGDFERLEERRGEQELMRVSENGEEPLVAEKPPSQPEPEPKPVPEPEPEPPAPEPESEPEPAPESELVRELEPAAELDTRDEALPAPASAAEPEPPKETRSWVDRLLGR